MNAPQVNSHIIFFLDEKKHKLFKDIVKKVNSKVFREQKITIRYYQSTTNGYNEKANVKIIFPRSNMYYIENKLQKILQLLHNIEREYFEFKRFSQKTVLVFTVYIYNNNIPSIYFSNKLVQNLDYYGIDFVVNIS